MNEAQRSLTVLVAALGGEGGGVLADWLVDAATREGLPAQSTSIPGVAQRTGATTYYLEIHPRRRGAGPEPVLSLTPSPGNVDLMVASELLEAGRALQDGYVTPERTTLIASTHRIYATAEKMPATDARFDGSGVLAAARELAARSVLFDMERIARDEGTVINAVLFGALAGSGVLPLSRAAGEAAIRAAGRGAEASLRGFAAGYALAASPQPPAAAAAPAPAPVDPRVAAAFPTATHSILSLGAARLDDYQGPRYTALYLERLRAVLAVDRGPAFELTSEVGRQLALWMAYEDIIRVAELKTRPERFARIRREVRAAAHEPVVVIDYLKPGLEEFAALLPRGLGQRLVGWAERRGRLDAYNVGLHLHTSAATGFLLMRALTWLRPWRAHGWRHADEQRLIGQWLAAILAAAPADSTRALALARTAEAVRGYGETRRRGVAGFHARLAALTAAAEPAPADIRPAAPHAAQ
ncbi:MAG: indolepyruvate oxidoreductase subunit beta family protein [Gammaproteobacteria bacterium]|nr:indolepyruvate oxidoreductase subunit beta family protein [Gammaproteobacteria bacterium]